MRRRLTLARALVNDPDFIVMDEPATGLSTTSSPGSFSGPRPRSNYFVVVVTPMVFASGVFFPLAQLPDWLRAIAQWLPLAAAVEIMRPLVLGRMPEHFAREWWPTSPSATPLRWRSRAAGC